ncbi:hypothetical protein A6E92_31700 [Streptomyces sp. S8]|nr:hypothetical protein A6E92_31700 [Streptomyces sp. S8]
MVGELVERQGGTLPGPGLSHAHGMVVAGLQVFRGQGAAVVGERLVEQVRGSSRGAGLPHGHGMAAADF